MPNRAHPAEPAACGSDRASVIDLTQGPVLRLTLEEAMTILRLISPALRSALIMTAGLALISAPIILGLDAAAVATALIVGVVMVALALAGTESSGRGTLPVSAQAVYDRGTALGLLLVAVIFGLADEPEAAIMFGVAGVAALVVASITSYSARPA
jgi:hypothetical protein